MLIKILNNLNRKFIDFKNKKLIFFLILILKESIVLGEIWEKKFNKLVRDNIPNIIEKNGDIPIYRLLNDEEYWKYLLKKDNEELLEVKAAKTIEERKKELADKLELIKAMAEFNGYSLDAIIEEANQKRNKNGGFTKRILLIRTK